MEAAELGDDAPAIRALGALFRITEAYLRGDASVVCRDESVEEPGISCPSVDANASVEPAANGYTNVEDLELAQEMEALGLPIAFITTKEKRNSATGGKRKGTRTKSVSANQDSENFPVLSGSDASQDLASSNAHHISTNISQCILTSKGHIYFDIEEMHGGDAVYSNRELMTVAAAPLDEVDKTQSCVEVACQTVSSNIDKELRTDVFELVENTETLKQHIGLNVEGFPKTTQKGTSAGPYHEDMSSNMECEDGCSELSSISCNKSFMENGDDSRILQPCSTSLPCNLDDHRYQNCHDNSTCFEFGDWKVSWDVFYLRYYFYNCQTQESTWDPPADLEYLGASDIRSCSKQMIDFAAEDYPNCGYVCNAIPNQDASSDMIDKHQETSSEIGNLGQPLEALSKVDIIPVAPDSAGDHLDVNCNAEKTCVEQISPCRAHVQICAKDEVDASECFLCKGEDETQDEVWNVHDISVETPTDNSLTVTNEVSFEEYCRASSLDSCIAFTTDEDSHHEIVTVKKKRKLRRRLSRLSLEEVTGDLSTNIIKYWYQRYLLFSQFDDGIKMDEEGWFSVTPESIARHHASRCCAGTVIDCFAGVGGNSIQFAMRSNHVISIDIDSQRIDYARHNAAIYGVSDKIDFINADFFKIARLLKGDVVFMSPPWGGPDYAKVQTYNIETMLRPDKGSSLFDIARRIASKVVMFLPRNVDLNQLAEISLSNTPPWTLEVEKNYLNGKLKAITAYFDRTAA